MGTLRMARPASLDWAAPVKSASVFGGSSDDAIRRYAPWNHIHPGGVQMGDGLHPTFGHTSSIQPSISGLTSPLTSWFPPNLTGCPNRLSATSINTRLQINWRGIRPHPHARTRAENVYAMVEVWMFSVGSVQAAEKPCAGVAGHPERVKERHLQRINKAWFSQINLTA